MLAIHRHRVFQRGYGLLSREEDQSQEEDHCDDEHDPERAHMVHASMETINKMIKPLHLVDMGAGTADPPEETSGKETEEEEVPQANSCLFVCSIG